MKRRFTWTALFFVLPSILPVHIGKQFIEISDLHSELSIIAFRTPHSHSRVGVSREGFATERVFQILNPLVTRQSQ
jgi:hypothetical protein